ncbi:MAG: ribosome-associated translation inhibitor RaiA [Clostridia bacterium]|nr:ribosome-associated translation inhibitor RaiA [Clostridia bacterium]
MKLEILEKDYDVSKRLKDIISDKVNKLDRYFDNEATCKVVCRKVKNMYKMEISILSKKTYYRAEVSNIENMYANIDLALPKIERQIIKYKGKLKDKIKADAFAVEGFEFVEDVVEEPAKTVVKTKQFEIAPMTTEEAGVMLEMLDHQFYIYRNIDTNAVNVIYKREDGNHGNIEILS